MPKKLLLSLLCILSAPALAQNNPQPNQAPNQAPQQQLPSIKLSFPAQCQLGQTCYIAPNGDGALNIALPTQAEMQQGVPVVAALAGQVMQSRDGMADNKDTQYTIQKGQECGNGILLRDPSGWQAQYCHLKNGSITVKPGDMVKAGQVIGQVGASGKADFPQLYFAVGFNGKAVNPFTPDIWAQPFKAPAIGLIASGLSTAPVNIQQLQQQTTSKNQFSFDDESVVAWVRVYGLQTGYKQRFEFYQPNGQLYGQAQESDIKQPLRDWLAYGGYPIKGHMNGVQKGQWKVLYQLLPPGQTEWKTLAQMSFTLQ